MKKDTLKKIQEKKVDLRPIALTAWQHFGFSFIIDFVLFQ